MQKKWVKKLQFVPYCVITAETLAFPYPSGWQLWNERNVDPYLTLKAFRTTAIVQKKRMRLYSTYSEPFFLTVLYLGSFLDQLSLAVQYRKRQPIRERRPKEIRTCQPINSVAKLVVVDGDRIIKKYIIGYDWIWWAYINRCGLLGVIALGGRIWKIAWSWWPVAGWRGCI